MHTECGRALESTKVHDLDASEIPMHCIVALCPRARSRMVDRRLRHRASVRRPVAPRPAGSRGARPALFAGAHRSRRSVNRGQRERCARALPSAGERGAKPRRGSSAYRMPGARAGYRRQAVTPFGRAPPHGAYGPRRCLQACGARNGRLVGRRAERHARLGARRSGRSDEPPGWHRDALSLYPDAGGDRLEPARRFA